jgi:small-conductance mechanosensitive channel
MDDFGLIVETLKDSFRSLGAEFTSVWFFIQIGMLLFAAGAAYASAAWVRKHIQLKSVMTGWPPFVRQLVFATYHIFPFIVFALLTAFLGAAVNATSLSARSSLLHIATSLATAWIVISLLAGLLRNQFVNRIVAISAWTIAALSILGLLDNMTTMLDRQSFTIGDLRISLLVVLKTTVLLVVGLWMAIVLGNFIDKRIQHTTDLTPSIQILLGKLVRVSLVALAIAIVLNTVGINLSALAWFSGAVGVGVGFGLQKIVSNLVSGIILLVDKSIKPGDLITVGEDAGWVSTISARYTLVTLRDGREVLVPNEDLVTQRVVNWSHTNDQVRLEVQFGVSYASDPHAVQKIALATVVGMPRILSTPNPTCVLAKFGDSSLDFKLRFWIGDPINGIGNIRSEIMFALWDAFKREGIEIPYPVRDVRVTTAAGDPTPQISA